MHSVYLLKRRINRRQLTRGVGFKKIVDGVGNNVIILGHAFEKHSSRNKRKDLISSTKLLKIYV